MNNKEPLVSVILPNYNHAQYLRQRIESILNQTYQDFELIILDDCSTDNSLDIIREYTTQSAKIIQTILNKENSGSPFIQWKRGFSMAKGKYIWIAESDDYADLTFLEKLVPLLEANEDCNIAISQSYFVDENNSILFSDWTRSPRKKVVDLYDGRIYVKAQLINNTLYNSSMILFRKSVLELIDDEFMKFRYRGDWLFWNEICLQGGVIRYHEKLNYFRKHSNNVTSKADSEGGGFKEDKFIISRLMMKLDLSKVQTSVIIGHFFELILHSSHYKTKEVRQEVIQDIKSYFLCNVFTLYLYKLDKKLNFTSLDIRKNRCI